MEIKTDYNIGKVLKKTTFYSIVVLSFFVMISCDSDSDNGRGEYLPDAGAIVLELREKIISDNTFAFDLFKTTYRWTAESNVFVSPLSVNMALSMTMNGARNTTMAEMKEALRAKNYSLDEINNYNKTLREA